MATFEPGDKVIVPDMARHGQETVAEVDGTWAIIEGGLESEAHYRVWVIMPDRTVRVYEKHEVRHIDTKEEADKIR